MKVAIVHDWLTVYTGAERALEPVLCYSHMDADELSRIGGLNIQNQKCPAMQPRRLNNRLI